MFPAFVRAFDAAVEVAILSLSLKREHTLGQNLNQFYYLILK